MIGYLDEVIRSLVLVLPKMTRYVKTLEEKNKKNDIDNDKLLEKTHRWW